MANADSSTLANPPGRVVIRDATVISMDPAVGDFRRASILIEGERIAAVAPGLDAGDAMVLDGTGLIALPGLVDAHRHVWQSLLSLTAAAADLEEYFSIVPGKLAPAYRPDDLKLANRLGALQALDAGVTTLFDWCHVLHTPDHSDAAVEGLRDGGVRAVFAYGFPNTGPEWSLDSVLPLPSADPERVRRDLLPGDAGLVTMAMALRGPEQSSLEVTESDLALARTLGLPISLHAGNGAFGLPYRAIERLDERGLLGGDLQFVHGTSLTDASLSRIVQTGGRLVVTPSVELQMQFGFPATTRFLAAGGRPGLGVDVVSATDPGLFGQMASAFQAARLQALESGTPALSPREVLGFATLDGARAVGLEDRVGSLTPGKQADIVLLRPDALAAVNDPVAFAVLGAEAAMVETVLVAGRVAKRDGRLLDVDPGDLSAKAEQRRAALFARAGYEPPIDSWPC